MVLGKTSSIISKRTQERISTAHCLMDAPAAGSWDTRFVSLRSRHLWDERKQMDVTDSTLKVFSRGSWNCTKEWMETCGHAKSCQNLKWINGPQSELIDSGKCCFALFGLEMTSWEIKLRPAQSESQIFSCSNNPFQKYPCMLYYVSLSLFLN